MKRRSKPRPRSGRSRNAILAWVMRGLPSRGTRRRWWGRYRRATLPTQLMVAACALGFTWFAINIIYQVLRKPTELFFPVSHALYKSPRETWESYAPIFRKHATATISAELLAALAQVEGSGNPVVRTYWRWSFTHRPFDVYRPASTAVGMMQITDGTFEQARRYCIHDHRVVEDGPWHAWDTCWFNWAYFRVVPSHAVEMTSAYLDRHVASIVARYPGARVTNDHRHTLATLAHLCGPAAAEGYARRGYRLLPNQRCGDHSAASYIAKVKAMKALFVRAEY